MSNFRLLKYKTLELALELSTLSKDQLTYELELLEKLKSQLLKYDRSENREEIDRDIANIQAELKRRNEIKPNAQIVKAHINYLMLRINAEKLSNKKKGLLYTKIAQLEELLEQINNKENTK